MFKKEKIHCKNCEKLFTPKSEKNIFCSRKCFKKDYYHRKKDSETSTNVRFICPECGNETILDFDITKNIQRWNNFSCPKCDVLFVNVFDEIIMTEETS